MAIRGLPGWEWHYPKGAPRYATDTHGRHYTVRDIQLLQHGQQYEKRVPPSERKKYIRKKGTYKRHGPFSSVEEMKNYTHISKDKSVMVQAHGQRDTHKKKKSPSKKGKNWRTVGAFTDWEDLEDVFDMTLTGPHDTTPAKAQYYTKFQDNLTYFTSIDKFYLYERT